MGVVLTVMLCGARDTETVLPEFLALAHRIGFEAWSFLDGTLLYRNSPAGGWEQNSAASVAGADVVVFAIVREHGEIAWRRELPAAVQEGVPLLILCLDRTYRDFRVAERAGTAAEDPLFAAMSDLEAAHQFTIVPFSDAVFPDILEQHLLLVLEQATDALRERNQRELRRLLLTGEAALTRAQMSAAQDLALDEFEDKQYRKRAIDVLIETDSLTEEAALALAASLEQGVARKVFAEIPRIAAGRSNRFFDALAEIANSSDDAGLGRRFALAAGHVDPELAISLLERLDLGEVGVQRRTLDQLRTLVEARSELRVEPMRARVIALVGRCRGGGTSIKDLAQRVLASLGAVG